jgi:hypothetical protein
VKTIDVEGNRAPGTRGHDGEFARVSDLCKFLEYVKILISKGGLNPWACAPCGHLPKSAKDVEILLTAAPKSSCFTAFTRQSSGLHLCSAPSIDLTVQWARTARRAGRSAWPGMSTVRRRPRRDRPSVGTVSRPGIENVRSVKPRRPLVLPTVGARSRACWTIWKGRSALCCTGQDQTDFGSGLVG